MSDTFADAPCRQTDPEVFFPSTRTEATLALTICATCPLSIQRDCARLAVETAAVDGVWAGEYLTRHPYTSDHVDARANVEELAGTRYRKGFGGRPQKTRRYIPTVPKDRCAHCERILVPETEKPRHKGQARYAAKGLCWGCYSRVRRAG